MYHSLKTFTDVQLLVQAIEWMATTEHCKQQAFNIANRDSPRYVVEFTNMYYHMGLICV